MDEEEMVARIEELERRLNWLYQATGHGAPYQATLGAPDLGAGGLSPAVMGLIASGKKIAAIKQYRKETGVGLADAKNIIDRLA